MKVVPSRWCSLMMLGAGLDAQLGVEVRERLVHEEDLRAADDGAAEGDALALTAGELLRLAVEELADAQQLGGFLHLAVDLRLRGLAQLEAERHVVVDAHVRVERVVLEHHRDVAILGRHVVDDPVADEDAAVGDLFQAREQRRLVVLPQPDGPTSTRNSLSAISRFRSLTATTSP